MKNFQKKKNSNELSSLPKDAVEGLNQSKSSISHPIKSKASEPNDYDKKLKIILSQSYLIKKIVISANSKITNDVSFKDVVGDKLKQELCEKYKIISETNTPIMKSVFYIFVIGVLLFLLYYGFNLDILKYKFFLAYSLISFVYVAKNRSITINILWFGIFLIGIISLNSKVSAGEFNGVFELQKEFLLRIFTHYDYTKCFLIVFLYGIFILIFRKLSEILFKYTVLPKAIEYMLIISMYCTIVSFFVYNVYISFFSTALETIDDYFEAFNDYKYEVIKFSINYIILICYGALTRNIKFILLNVMLLLCTSLFPIGVIIFLLFARGLASYIYKGNK